MHGGQVFLVIQKDEAHVRAMRASALKHHAYAAFLKVVGSLQSQWREFDAPIAIPIDGDGSKLHNENGEEK